MKSIWVIYSITQEVPLFMNCTSCGKPLAPGVAFCPVCGASTPYNTSGQGSPGQYDPTEASSPYGSGQSYPPLPPTVAAGSDNYAPQAQNPYGSYTNYGSQQQQPPYNPYGTPPPAYGENPPQPPPINPGGSGPYYNNQAPGYPSMQPGTYGTPPKKRSKVGLIIGIVVLALVLLCGGVIFAAVQLGKGASTTIKNSIATATTATSNVPANSDAVPAATKILFGAQTSSAVDSNYNPTKVTTTFVTGKDVDLTFQVNSAGKDGYIKVQWFEDGQQVASDILQHHAANDHGYFGQTFDAAGSGAAALYWCTKSNCSDAQLAQVVSFSVTATGANVPTHTNVAIHDWKGTQG
jgi:flagellar basal body-associated protein FliL